MPLTVDEAQEAFRFLSNALREQGLAWVLTQVEEKLALGKVQTKKLRARELPEYSDDNWLLESRRDIPPTKRALFAVAQEYSAQERLSILLESLTVAIPTLHEVALRTFVSLEDAGGPDQIAFEPEADVSESFALRAEDIEARTQAIVRLRELIEELRREIGHADQAKPAR